MLQKLRKNLFHLLYHCKSPKNVFAHQIICKHPCLVFLLLSRFRFLSSLFSHYQSFVVVSKILRCSIVLISHTFILANYFLPSISYYPIADSFTTRETTIVAAPATRKAHATEGGEDAAAALPPANRLLRPATAMRCAPAVAILMRILACREAWTPGGRRRRKKTRAGCGGRAERGLSWEGAMVARKKDRTVTVVTRRGRRPS